MSENTERMAAVIRQRLTGTLEPLRKEHDQIERRIQELDEEVAELRKLRTELRRMLAVIDPEIPIKGRRKTSPRGIQKRAGAETLTQVREWLETNIQNGEPFSTVDLINERGFDLVAQSTLSTALAELARADVIRLDHVGGPRRMTKFYKLAI